jgi:hypothetical protein
MKLLLSGFLIFVLTGCHVKNSSEKTPVIELNLSSDTHQSKNVDDTLKVTHDDIINTNLIKINGIIPYTTSKDSLLLLMKTEPVIKKIFEECVHYGSNNDTLEFMYFNDSTIEYVYYNGHVEFVSIQFENENNKVVIDDYVISGKTTLDELCSRFPNSCRNASFDKSKNETTLRFHPREGFYEYYEFWSITFNGNKIKYMRLNMTC